MSVLSQSRLQGFSLLLQLDGEDMQFRGAALKAIVNRGIDVEAQDKGSINFGDSDGTRIEFLKTAVVEAPRPGEFFRDAQDQLHRIKTTQRTDISYRCHTHPEQSIAE